MAIAVTGADSGADILCVDLVRIFKVVAARGQSVEVQALQGLNLRVDPGELVAVIGASGSGKSTLLSILSSLDQPTAGVAWVAGHDLLTMKEKERVAFRRRSVGFVWQQTARNLLPYLTASENLAAALAVTGRQRGPAARRARVAELLDLLEVSHCAERKPAEMSGGEQQRVAIAVGIANDPRVLLADEPTGELDESTSAHVLEAMRAVNRELAVTTLIVTHDPSVSEHVARTVQIRDGRTSTEVLRSTRLDEHGDEHHVAEEYAVVDRVGRLQLPDEFVDALDLRDRVRLALEPDHVAVRPGRSDPDTGPGPAPGARSHAAPGITPSEREPRADSGTPGDPAQAAEPAEEGA